MSNENVVIDQTKAMIHDWNHELIELKARVAQAAESPEQLQIAKQRIIELESQIEDGQKHLSELQGSK